MIRGAPPGTLGLATPSGWMNQDLFLKVMEHFIKYSSSSKENPALLIYDKSPQLWSSGRVVSQY